MNCKRYRKKREKKRDKRAKEGERIRRKIEKKTGKYGIRETKMQSGKAKREKKYNMYRKTKGRKKEAEKENHNEIFVLSFFFPSEETNRDDSLPSRAIYFSEFFFSPQRLE